ncbi:MAG: leucine--tRNA ligase [Candidatus Micrarchaeota archaeon]|nr:leucine--tRNA ligase [Candidatus Micrarchaeota archaeon]
MNYEEKILELWEREGRHIARMNQEKPKYFITAAFPYPNSPQHIGHARTYTLADVMARYYRLLGYSVLFPMGFHVTGTPIVAMADRIKEGDKELFEIFEKIYGIPREQYTKLTDPKDLVLFFANEIETGMRRMGYMIDWSRKFYTFDPKFERFIHWQMKKLYDKGFLIRGKHPIPYSPRLNSSVGAHDTKGDIDPEIEEYTGILFESPYGYLVASTLRPETIYGITNIWIREDVEYIVLETDKKIIVSEEAWKRLKYQFSNYREIGRLKGKELIGKNVKVPLLGIEIPIIHGSIVKPEEGTGIVMSVPGHSVYDNFEYRKLKREYPIIISINGKPSDAGQRIPENGDLEMANKELYRDEFTNGYHIPLKMSVKEARERTKEDLYRIDRAIRIYKIANGPIYSRAGDEVVVKILDDQWFINYGDRSWKRLAQEHLNSMKIIPEEFRTRFKNTIEWLDRKACTRSRGLGTRFLYDQSQIVESLSDSTIYMAVYILVPYLNNYRVEQLDESFFDYIFYGIGKPIDSTHERMREEFLYWYGVDARHSGVDLITNHLTFYIFNHVALFPKEKLPKAIVTNGSVLMDGKKMSKSLGNIIPLKRAIEQYGADTVRMAVVANSDIKSDTNFSDTIAKGIKERIHGFIELFRRKGEGNVDIQNWIRTRFYSRLKEIKELYSNYEIKRVADSLFYEFYNDLQWAIRRGMNSIPDDVIRYWNIAMFPIIPFTTDMLHRELFGRSIYDETLEIPDVKTQPHPEDLFREMIQDLETLRNLREFRSVRIGIAKPWKFEVYRLLSERVKMQDIIKKYPEAKDLISKLKNRAYTIEFKYSHREIMDYLVKNRNWIESNMNISVEIGEEMERYALPDKPEFLIR